jgi:hypothetical protein
LEAEEEDEVVVGAGVEAEGVNIDQAKEEEIHNIETETEQNVRMVRRVNGV